VLRLIPQCKRICGDLSLNIKFIAEYCGTSVAMIEQQYGRFLKHQAGDQLRLLESAPAADSS
jgi:hypothetical protein